MGFAEECARITDERNDTERWVEFAVKHICEECIRRAGLGLQNYHFYDFEHGREYYQIKTPKQAAKVGLIKRWEHSKELIPIWAKEMFDADRNNIYYTRWKPLIVKRLREEGFRIDDTYSSVEVKW